MVDGSPPSPARRVRAWPWIVATAAVVGLATVSMWYQAVPRGGGVCPLPYPAPPGCSPERVPVAALWSTILAVLLGAQVVGAQVVGARRLPRWRRPWLVASTVAMVVLAMVAFRIVKYT